MKLISQFNSDSRRISPHWWAAAILILAALIRFYQLGSESLWLDEGFSASMAMRSLPDLFKAVRQYDYNPPLYYVLLKGWTGVFGTSEAALRMPSVLFSVAGLGTLYALGRELTGSGAALAATLLGAITLYDVRFAQEARAYSMLNMLSALSMLAYVKMIFVGRRRWTVAYLIITPLLLYSHPCGIFPVIIQNIHWLTGVMRRRPMIRWKHWISLELVLLVLFIPRLIRTFSITSSLSVHPTHLKPPGLADLFEAFRMLGAYHSGFTVLLLAAALAAFWPRPRRSTSLPLLPSDKTLPIIQLWFILAVAIPFVLSYLVTPMFSGRYLLAGSYPFYLLVVLGVFRVPRYRARLAAGLIIVGLSLIPLARYYPKVQNGQWREATTYLDQHAATHSTILFHADFCLTTIYPYYATRTDLVTRGVPRRWFNDNPTIPILADSLNTILPPHHPVWLVKSHAGIDKKNQVVQALKAILGPPEKISFKDIELFKYPAPQP